MNIPSPEGLGLEHMEPRSERVERIRERAAELFPEMERLYEDFHLHPELGGEEYRTAARVQEELGRLGVEIVSQGIGIGTKNGRRAEGTGIVALIRGKEDGPTIALRADMDALPVDEDPSHQLRSETENVMHACGHDLHTAGLLGAARMLKELAEGGSLEGNVVLLFQPSEEKAHQKESGAVQIVRSLEESGIREKINAFLGLHVKGDLERGTINVRDEFQTASSGEVDIALRGPGGHIMRINEIPDLQQIMSRITLRLKDVFRPLYAAGKGLVGSARTTYSGQGYNVLPAESRGTYVVRIADPRYKEVSIEVVEKIREAVEEAVEAERAEKPGSEISVDVRRRPGYRPIVHRDPELVNLVASSAKEVLPNSHRDTGAVMAGEDFSFYLEKFRGREIAGVFAMVGAANPDAGYPRVEQHSSKFRVDPHVLEDLAALHTRMTVNVLAHFRNKTS